MNLQGYIYIDAILFVIFLLMTGWGLNLLIRTTRSTFNLTWTFFMNLVETAKVTKDNPKWEQRIYTAFAWFASGMITLLCIIFETLVVVTGAYAAGNSFAELVAQHLTWLL